MDPFLGQTVIFAGNFAPRGWAFCAGQLLPISQYSALFSILGTIYGGDGRTTFALPDLRGRVAIGEGNGPGLSSYRLGEKGGAETTTIALANMPSHNHTAAVDIKLSLGVGPATENLGNGRFLATAAADNIYNDGAAGLMANGGTVSTVTVNNNGGSQPVNNIQPYLAINYIIALQGVFPSRS